MVNMGQQGKFLRRVENGWAHYCPGCEILHVFAVDKPFSNGAKWSFNGDLEKPTFTPSMNIGNNWCHYNLTAGILIFTAGNKGHALSDKKIPLPELPEEFKD